MKAKIISLALFVLLSYAWYTSNINLIEFYSYIVFVVCFSVLICGLYMCFIFSEFDEGRRSKGTAENIVNASKGGVVYGFTVGLITNLASIYMLIDVGFTLTAFALLFIYLATAKLKLSSIKRRKILSAELL